MTTQILLQGEEATILVQQMIVSVRWSTAVDLDLMVFYRAIDGREGGVFSPAFARGSMGNLTEFPFIGLSGDAGPLSGDSRKEETVRIAELNSHAQIDIVMLDYEFARRGATPEVAILEGEVVVRSNNGHIITFPLGAGPRTAMRHVCRLVGEGTNVGRFTPVGLPLDLAGFALQIPGAIALTS